MLSYFLVQPIASTRASDWEKRQVEGQLDLMRKRLFILRLRIKRFAELKGWLVDKCVVWVRPNRHLSEIKKMIWGRSKAERSHLVPYA